MGKFSLSGSIPKKVLYNGVEVKKILFNNVEVWRKTIEAGSKSVTMTSKDSDKTLSFTVPDGVTKLKITTSTGYNESLTVSTGENVNFVFHGETNLVHDGDGIALCSTYSYSFNGSSFKYMAKVISITNGIIITVSWSEAINNS